LVVVVQTFFPVGQTHWFEALQRAPVGQQVLPHGGFRVLSQQNFWVLLLVVVATQISP
jgi:hypothetical protein